MNSDVRLEPRTAAVLGALVADSASLGLHWLYDFTRIEQIEKNKGLVFLQPDVSHYADVSGYFAHEQKISGDSSGYGELCLLMLQHYARHGQFNRIMYQTEYRNYFGPGGAYVGYVDLPTRRTLQTLLPLKPEEFPEISGADDDQLAALATLPIVVASHIGSEQSLNDKIERIVRLTNHNDTAVAAARYMGCVLLSVLNGESVRQAFSNALPHAGATLIPLLEEVLQIRSLDSNAIAKRFGSACHVQEGLPVIAHIVQHAPDYRTAVEENIRIGGDSCGRSIMLGAVAAARYSSTQNTGISMGWVARYRKLSLAIAACEHIPDTAIVAQDP